MSLPSILLLLVSITYLVNKAQINKHRETKVSFHFHLDSVLLVHHVLLYPSINRGKIVTRYDNYTNTVIIIISIETSNKNRYNIFVNHSKSLGSDFVF